jgi:CBS domain-containing protein
MDIRSIIKPPQTVSPDEYATRIRAMLREKERIIFVIDGSKLLNVITRKDAMLVTSTKSNLKAREIMSYPVLTLAPDEEIHEVGRKMIKKDTYSAPVVEGSRVLGVVHMGDILQAIYRPSPKKVSDIMTTQVVSCNRAEEITKVWSLMEIHNFTGLPITEEVSSSRRRYNRLAGMVTRKDILRAGEIRPGGDRKRFTSPPPVEKVMTRTPKYVRPIDAVDLCVELFRKYRIGRLPVVGDGFELVGIVDREDILQLYV